MHRGGNRSRKRHGWGLSVARILVTGAAGFVGRALCPALAARGHHVIAGLRRTPSAGVPPIAQAEPRVLGDIVPGRDWAGDLRDVDAVIHLAQRAHRRTAAHAFADEPEAAACLARGAAQAGIRRLLYLSSIKAMGEATEPGRPFRADGMPRPVDAYGRAKLATEQALRAVAARANLQLVILRPPLIYGPGAGGNFRALVRLASGYLPLPFAALDNRRSLIYVGNLVDLAATALLHPVAAGGVMLAADGTELSTAALVRLLAEGQGRHARLFRVPGGIFAAVRAMPGIGPLVRPLTLSLQLDDRTTRTVLGWTPPFAPEAALIATARALAAG